MSNGDGSFVTLAVLVSILPATVCAAGGFTDVSRTSGVEEIVRKHGDFQPKPWVSGMTLADLEGNGRLDLLIGDHGGVGCAGRNDGKGHFVFVDPQLDAARSRHDAAALPYPGGEVRMIYDLNGDGKSDVLASYGDGQGVAYLNAPGVGQTPAWNFKVCSPGFDPFSRSVAFADINRDGIVDYLYAGDGSGTDASIVFGKRDGRWGGGITLHALRESGAIAVDLDGDGFLDLLVSQRGYNPTQRMILLNDGKMNFRDASKACGLASDAGSIHGFGDLTGKGRMDLICVEGADIVIYLNDGKAHFTKGPPVVGIDSAKARPASTNWGGAVVTDFDNDSVPDILINGKYFLYVLRGLGGGKFELASSRWDLPTEIQPAVDEGACFGDIDNDGMLDIITQAPAKDGDPHGVAVFHNDLPKQNFINVQLVGASGNIGAANATIRVFEAGSLNDVSKLVWTEQISIWGRQSFHSNYFARHTERHIGLGQKKNADVLVKFYPSGEKLEARSAPAGKILLVSEPTHEARSVDLH